MLLKLFFKDQPVIEVAVDSTPTGRLYFELLKKNNSESKPIFKDNLLWTPEYLIELAKIAKKELGWNWLADEYSIELSTKLHKDLEYSVGRVGFENFPEEYDWLLYDLHHCLHSIQFGKTQAARDDNLQIEWLNDDCIPLPEEFEFSTTLRRGDLILINPYVGHNPLQLYMENDYSDLNSTCKFHDVIKAAVVISGFNSDIDKQEILNTFKKNAPEFVEQVTEETLLYYTGAAKIGRVIDYDVFESVMQTEELLEFEKLELHDEQA